MSFQNIFSFRKKDPVPAVSTDAVVDLGDMVRKQIEKLIGDIMWSGDTTFRSRDGILGFISDVADGMKTKQAKMETTTDISTEKPFSEENAKIAKPEKVVRTRLKPLTSAIKADSVQ